MKGRRRNGIARKLPRMPKVNITTTYTNLEARNMAHSNGYPYMTKNLISY